MGIRDEQEILDTMSRAKRQRKSIVKADVFGDGRHVAYDDVFVKTLTTSQIWSWDMSLRSSDTPRAATKTGLERILAVAVRGTRCKDDEDVHHRDPLRERRLRHPLRLDVLRHTDKVGPDKNRLRQPKMIRILVRKSRICVRLSSTTSFTTSSRSSQHTSSSSSKKAPTLIRTMGHPRLPTPSKACSISALWTTRFCPTISDCF